MRRGPHEFLHDQSGQTAIEYGLICALIFLAIVGAITTYANKTVLMFNNIAAKV